MAQGSVQRAHLFQAPVDGQAVSTVGYEVEMPNSGKSRWPRPGDGRWQWRQNGRFFCRSCRAWRVSGGTLGGMADGQRAVEIKRKNIFYAAARASSSDAMEYWVVVFIGAYIAHAGAAQHLAGGRVVLADAVRRMGIRTDGHDLAAQFMVTAHDILIRHEKPYGVLEEVLISSPLP